MRSPSRKRRGAVFAVCVLLTVAAGALEYPNAGLREKYVLEFGAYELRPPLLADACAPGFHGRVTELERLTPTNVVAEEARAWSLSAWRGERVHAQAVVWTDLPREGLRLVTGALTSAAGATIPASRVSGRFVKYVLAVPRRQRDQPAEQVGQMVGDCLDDIPALAMPSNSFRPVWFTVDVPRETPPGDYRGIVSAVANGGARIDFTLNITVVRRTLPAERKIFLDFWQNPWAVARYHGVTPFSKIHYDLMRPLYKELAQAGQKVITTTIGDYPWNQDTYFDNYRSMVRYVWRASGERTCDFSLFDEYVAFAESCGIGPQIHCYTMVKFGSKSPTARRYYYTDEATGDERYLTLDPAESAFADYWAPFLKAFEAHVREKGWVGRVYIALDELPPPAAKAAADLIARHAPSLRFAIASDKNPMGYAEAGVKADNFSQAMRIRGGRNLITPEFLKTIPARRAAGLTTTYYICNIPERPNTWILSPLVESAWQGLYAAARGFDGMLRWAAFHWPRDPMFDGSYGHYEPGEAHLLYPGARASTRWEVLRDSFENFEKIRILRENGVDMTRVDAALAEIDFEPMVDAPESVYRAKVAAVHAALEAAAASRPARSANDSPRRAAARAHFQRNVYGVRPCERPADLAFAEEGPAEACFDGAAVRKRIRATFSGPGGTGEMHFAVWIPKAKAPVPVFIHSSPRPAETAADPNGPRPVYLLPAEQIVRRGYAVVAYCNADIAPDDRKTAWTSGVFRVFGPTLAARTGESWGVLSAWAWGMSRIVDWVETEPLLDARRCAAVGLSRNGKTALVAGASDPRFALTISCCSGCSGARLNAADRPGCETIEVITRVFPHWFCRNYRQFAGLDAELDFDQDELLALIAPRLLYVSSATDDAWACPIGEYEGARRASAVWEALGQRGLVSAGFPAPDTPQPEGRVGYHLRSGSHSIQPADWSFYLDFADRHLRAAQD